VVKKYLWIKNIRVIRGQKTIRVNSCNSRIKTKTMKDLIIIGARGFGRVIFNLAISCPGYKSEYRIKGFLDDKTDVLDDFEGYPPILGSVENYEIQKDDVFICALGDVKSKKKYSEIILDKGGKFISLIHPTAIIGTNVKIGKACIISSNAYISCDVKIDDFVTIQPFTVISHNVEVGKWCHLDAYMFLGGEVKLEEAATIHTGAIIHPKKKIQNGAIVGAGAMVIRNVKSNTTVYGNPAKLL
jgi:sugar O-acyltransferase (sialic acid O-acetyltransferase NeuD family)